MTRLLDIFCAMILLVRLWLWMNHDRAMRVHGFVMEGDWCWKYMAYDMISAYPSMPTSRRVEPEMIGTQLMHLASDCRFRTA